MSVGEWLNSVIRPGDPDYGDPMRFPDDEDDYNDGWRNDDRPQPRQEPRREYRQEPHRELRGEPRREYGDNDRHDSGSDYREPTRRRRRERNPDYGREIARERESAREREAARESEATQQRKAARELEAARHREAAREREAVRERQTALAREEFGEVHARLDKLTNQLERIARPDAPTLTGAPASPQRGRPASPVARPRARRSTDQSSAPVGGVSVDDAVAEIAARQRALNGEAPLYREPPEHREIPDSREAFAHQPRDDRGTRVSVPLPMRATAAATGAPEEPVAPPPATLMAAAPATPSPAVSAPPIDISNLEQQLRDITARIELLRPTNELEGVITAFRKDLADISRQLTEALPRHAVESLEIEVQGLAQRIDHSRDHGGDSTALAGLERGLAEVRDALRGLTPAENLVGFDDAVRSLAQKVDLIIAKEDPATLQQLETAIGALRGIVSHVASNDTLTKVADDVRSLAAKVDSLAGSAASGHAVSMLENRLDTLANALNASAEAGHAVPRELEKLLGGLIEKLEWVQLTHTDHAALGHLEDRIAQLIKRLDASDAKLGNLEAVERGVADLLVHIDQARGGSAPAAAIGKPVVVDAIERDVAEIKRSERRTQDSLEAVHGAVEHVVGRLAIIESNIHGATPEAAPRSAREPAPADEAPPEKAYAKPLNPAFASAREHEFASAPELTSSAAEPAAHRAGAARQPIDPNLPPDHPLEPGSAAGPRAVPSAADRIAASEAAAGFAKSAGSAEPDEKPNFIAAARRAAQAAAAAAPERKPRVEIEGMQGEKPTRLRKLLVAGGVVLIAFGCVHIALRMFQDNGQDNGSVGTQPPVEQTAPPTVLPERDSAKDPSPQPSGPLILPIPETPSDTAPVPPPKAMPGQPQSLAPEPVPSANPAMAPAATPITPAVPAAPSIPAAPARQSALPDPIDITGSLPRRAPATQSIIAPAQAPADTLSIEKLPATIAGPTLRAAALAGNAAAAFEVATRFAEGRGVPPSNEQAARWLERAANQGLAPAQFRLGGFYEKGIGVKKDLAAARDLYLAAAAKGNGKAMHNLAVLYAEGINGPADYHAAARWFLKAADRGITDSQYNLAILYARGVGVEQNYAESYKWFQLAADAGDNDAAKKRDEVALHLDQQSLAAAELSVQKWAAEPQPDDATSVKTPAGGWDPPAQAAKAKPRPGPTKAQTF